MSGTVSKENPQVDQTGPTHVILPHTGYLFGLTRFLIVSRETICGEMLAVFSPYCTRVPQDAREGMT